MCTLHLVIYILVIQYIHIFIFNSTDIDPPKESDCYVMNELLENEEDISFESQEDRWDDLGLDIFGQNITSRN